MKNNLTPREYATRVGELRQKLWELARDMGAVVSTEEKYADMIYHDMLHADLVAMFDTPLF